MLYVNSVSGFSNIQTTRQSRTDETTWESEQRRILLLFLNVFSESEDEVEEIEERVPSPDGAAEEAAPFYDPVAW